MWNHLRSGAQLPASQVVRAVPRGVGAPQISVAVNLPPIIATPAAGDAINFNTAGNVVQIPNWRESHETAVSHRARRVFSPIDHCTAPKRAGECRG